MQASPTGLGKVQTPRVCLIPRISMRRRRRGSELALTGGSDTECHLSRQRNGPKRRCGSRQSRRTRRLFRGDVWLCSLLEFLFEGSARQARPGFVEMYARCYDGLLRRPERRTTKQTRNPSRSKRRPVQALHLFSISDTSTCRKARRLPRRQLRQGHARHSHIRHKCTSCLLGLPKRMLE